MGDRTWWSEKCPKCENEIEVYDAPSCLQFSRRCEKCNWTDGLEYFEAPDNVIELCTQEQAREKGLIKNCPNCSKTMTWWEEVEYKECIMCKQDKDKLSPKQPTLVK